MKRAAPARETEATARAMGAASPVLALPPAVVRAASPCVGALVVVSAGVPVREAIAAYKQDTALSAASCSALTSL